MRKKLNKKTELKLCMNFKKCGAITCINNIQGLCNYEKCELYERSLVQEY